MEETLDQISPILPIDFFSLSLDLYYIEKTSIKKLLKKKYLVPNFSEFLFEDSFAKVFMGWNEEGLLFDVWMNKKFEESLFPNFRKGDSIELFIDTRDFKSAGFPTRFCHHFVILGQNIDGISAREVTSFRSEDRHELSDSEKIFVERDFGKRNFFLKIFIPRECLHGYDPISFKRLGFSYQINRFGGSPEHLAPSSDYLAIENQPSLWPSMQMRKR